MTAILHSCNGRQVTGSPVAALALADVPDGDTVSIGFDMPVDAYAIANGGEGGLAHPNRVRSADALLDASNTAKLYVTVLTPGPGGHLCLMSQRIPASSPSDPVGRGSDRGPGLAGSSGRELRRALRAPPEQRFRERGRR